MATDRADVPSSSWRLSAGAAAFAVLVAGVPIWVAHDGPAALALAVSAGIWTVGTAADRRGLAPGWTNPIEALLVGLACGLSGGPGVLAALGVSPFRAGLRSGLRGFATSFLVELTALAVGVAIVFGGVSDGYLAAATSWVLVALGLGLIGSFQHDTTRPPDPLAPYRAAQDLLHRLLDLSGDLTSSLDAVTLGTQLAETVRAEVPVTAACVYVPREEVLVPLATSAGVADPDQESLAVVAARSFHAAAPQVHGQGFAFPIMSDPSHVVGVLAGQLPSRLDPQDLVISGQLRTLTARAEATAVMLDTALMFSRLRDTATADERRRLAREIHDGVAQDIASLGYLVDVLAAAPSTPEQAERLQMLRRRITDVVSEVRRSVQTLRTDAGASESLGGAVSALARHLGESAGIPIRVTVDEGTSRLRPEVESELLRIAQEAMNNAVRHGRPTVVDVLVRVAAPAAELVVRDNGQGMQAGRPDSHGLSIMRERAALVDGDLAIEAVFPHGTEVSLRIGGFRDRASTTPTAADGTVTT